MNTKVDELNEKIFNYETEIVEAKIEDGSTSELGPLKYLSGLTGLPMDKIINYLLLVIIFVFDPLAIALVVAANFAFARLKKPTKENLYGETIQIENEEEAEKRMNIIGQNGNEGLHYEEEQKPNNREKIEKLEKEAAKMINRPLYRSAYNKVKNQIQKLKDEDNTITY